MKFHNISLSIENKIHWLDNWVAWIGRIAIFLMMLLVVSDVFGRFALSKPVRGAMDLGEVLMVIVVFLQMGYCTFKQSHVRVDLLVDRLSKRTQAILETITSFASLVIFALIAYELGITAWEGFISNQGRATMLLNIPTPPFMLLAAIGCLFLCLELIVNLSRSLAIAIGRKTEG